MLQAVEKPSHSSGDSPGLSRGRQVRHGALAKPGEGASAPPSHAVAQQDGLLHHLFGRDHTFSTAEALVQIFPKPEMAVMAARSSCRSMSLSYSTSTSPTRTCSRAYRLSRPMTVPAFTALVRRRLAPRAYRACRCRQNSGRTGGSAVP